MVADHFAALLQGFRTAYIHTHGRIELQRAAAGRGLGVAEHHADLLTQLVNEDHDTVRTGNDCGELTQGLGHQTGLQTDMCISHVTVDLCLRHQCRDRVDDHDIQRAGTHHGLGDLQRLLSGVRLGDIEVVNIHADILRIDRIQCMLRINKTGNTVSSLHFRDHMQCDRCLTTGFRTVDLHDPAAGNPAEAECQVQAQGTGGNCLYIHMGRCIPKTHHGALSIRFLDLCNSSIQCFQLVFLCHSFLP